MKRIMKKVQKVLEIDGVQLSKNALMQCCLDLKAQYNNDLRRITNKRIRRTYLKYIQLKTKRDMYNAERESAKLDKLINDVALDNLTVRQTLATMNIKEDWKKQQVRWFFNNMTTINRIINGIIEATSIRRVRRDKELLRNQIDESLITNEDVISYVKEQFISKRIPQNKYIGRIRSYAKYAVQRAFEEYFKRALESVSLMQERLGEEEVPGDVYHKMLTRDLEYDETRETVGEFFSILSTEQRNILAWLMQGLTQRDIAKKLGIGLDAIAEEINKIRLFAKHLGVFDKKLIARYVE